ncbi:MAG: hypothetical protein M3N46_04275, partial [Actinomycetota bacterium]|nr:hypothetical protein [Actinomycetota bacterium]
ALVGSLALIAVIGGGVALGVAAPGSPLALPDSSQRAEASASSTSEPTALALPFPSPSADDPANTSALGGTVGGAAGTVTGVGSTVDGVGKTVNGIVGGATGVVNGVTAPILAPITGGAPAVAATVDLHLSGTGTPGATVSAQVAGAVYTTVVASNGGWSITVAGLPKTVTNADATISQKAGLLNGLLGALLAPLTLNVNSLGLHISLLN